AHVSEWGEGQNLRDLRETGVHAGAVERGMAALTSRLDNLGLRRTFAEVIGVTVVAGDPVGGGDDVDAGLQHLSVEVDIRPDPMECHAIRAGGEDVLERAGRGDADLTDAGDLAGIAPDLVR